MKKIYLSLLIMISFQTDFFAQIDTKSEKEILQEIEWISTHPVQQSNKEFLSRTSDFIKFQMVNYPNFALNYKAFFEFLDSEKDYKYYDEISFVYMSNQLVYKIQNKNSYDLTESSFKSLEKVLNYYKLVLEKEPNEKSSVLDNYLAMTKTELKRQVKQNLSK